MPMTPQRSTADPMPTSIAPMLAQLANTLPTDDLSYGYEFKWDGFRAVAFIDAGRLRMLSRSGQDYTSRLPTLGGMGGATGSRRRLGPDNASYVGATRLTATRSTSKPFAQPRCASSART